MRHYVWGDAAVSQFFGLTPWASSYAVFGMRGHNGWDLAVWSGTRLHAPEAGIAFCRNDPGGYGLNVKIVTDAGDEWILAHLSGFAIGGGRVERGQFLGFSGNTGNSSGPHLHLGLRPAGHNPWNGFLGYIDPGPRLAALQREEDAELTAGAAAGPTPQDDQAALEAALEHAGVTEMENMSDDQVSAVGAYLWGAVPFVLDNGVARAWADDLRTGKYRGIPDGGETDVGEGCIVQKFIKGGAPLVAIYAPGVGTGFAE